MMSSDMRFWHLSVENCCRHCDRNGRGCAIDDCPRPMNREAFTHPLAGPVVYWTKRETGNSWDLDGGINLGSVRLARFAACLLNWCFGNGWRWI